MTPSAAQTFASMTNLEIALGERSFKRLGMGCWAIGGPLSLGGVAIGWGPTDDAESIRALRAAFDCGIRFFDTADLYGAGHAEKLLPQALAEHRDEIFYATKFGNRFDEARREMLPEPGVSPEYIRAACEASLQRLDTDRIDLYQFHVNGHPADRIDDVLATLDALKSEGKIRAYGWSTDFPERARAFLKGEGCASFQFQYNLFDANEAMVELCEKSRMIGINRGPLAMGLLTGKYQAGARLHDQDVRGANAPSWMQYFKDGQPNPVFLKKLDAAKEILRSGGRSLVQGALAWIWAKSPRNLPIPGIRSVAQAEENAGALAFGQLASQQVDEIERLLGRA